MGGPTLVRHRPDLTSTSLAVPSSQRDDQSFGIGEGNIDGTKTGKTRLGSGRMRQNGHLVLYSGFGLHCRLHLVFGLMGQWDVVLSAPDRRSLTGYVPRTALKHVIGRPS